jgi:hypothetical protein
MNPLLIRPYVSVLDAHFRWMKVPLSQLTDRFAPRAPANLPAFGSLDDYVKWMGEKLRWRSDGLGGVWDTYPSLENMAWQLENKGYIEDDCDGLAYFSALMVQPFADSERDVYIVSIVLNPRYMPLNQAAHVVCVFRTAGAWRVISNTEIYPRRYPTFAEAVAENPYTRGQEVKLVEVRDVKLQRVSAPEY